MTLEKEIVMPSYQLKLFFLMITTLSPWIYFGILLYIYIFVFPSFFRLCCQLMVLETLKLQFLNLLYFPIAYCCECH